MKVHTLDIDSGDRDPILYPDSGDYTVFLNNPIYNVSKLKLISARIHNSQLLIHDRNNTFTMNTATYSETVTLPNGNYEGAELASNLVQHSDIVDTATYLSTTNDIEISNLTNDFTIAFYGGENGYTSDTTQYTTPHDVLGLPPNNVHSTSNSLKTGSINLQGVDAFVLKLSSGSDEFNKTIYFNTPFYTGKILTFGDVVNYSGADDTLEYDFHSGEQQTISSIRVQFFYSSNGRLIPYDFRNANHVLKFALTCSTDKLENVPKVKIPVDEGEEEKKKEESDSKVEKYTIHGTENEAEDVDRWNAIMSIIFIILVGFVLLLIPKRKPTT